ncbi:lysosomal acid phosphatase-like [Macrosteles quadrilineatus]|uniref:lysosomal acid phosphatase-like n=1 Tax=Macrosteles quadrilineatus TaxID=74068 RepID=UPI0023E32BE2|nr:lysosomal acid phosphatase-like [Macrosteles quadrilineatus]
MVSCSAQRCGVYVFTLLVLCGIIAYAVYNSLNTNVPDNTPSSGARAVPSLRFVVVITRHGNRRPLFSFPKEPYPDIDWGCELGEITKEGKLEMYNLGQKVRSLYKGFINNTYSSNDFYATSTALERTLVSGEAFLAGLYPPLGNQIWNKDIAWQPIPIYTDSPDGSQIGHYPCPRYVSEITKTSSKVYETNMDIVKNVSDYLNEYSGGNASAPHYLYNVWDSLSTDKIEGFVLPEWTKPVYPEPLSYIIGQLFIAMSAGTDTITRIVSGELIIQMIGLMEEKINSTLTPDYKMYYYSAHDMTIVALQAILGIPWDDINGLINPGSAMIWELHQDSSANYYVQVLYIDGLSPDLQPVAVNTTGCPNTSCSFPMLLNVTAKFRNFTSVHDECYSTD